VTAVVEYLSIAWPGLLVLAGFVALIIHAARDYRRKHPRGHYRIPAGHELFRPADRTLTRRWVRDYDDEQAEKREAGRVLASRRDDLIAQGVDPLELRIPLAPDSYTDDAGMYRSRRRPGRAG
jgi:hypothetical protein